MIFTFQQFRALYVQLSFNAQRKLTASEFIAKAAERGVYVSAMTASSMSNDFDVLTEVETKSAAEELLAV